MTAELTTVICPGCQRRVNARPATGGFLMNQHDHERGCRRAGTVKTKREVAGITPDSARTVRREQ